MTESKAMRKDRLNKSQASSQGCPAKEKAIKWLGNWSSQTEVLEAIDIALQEQAKEIKKWVENKWNMRCKCQTCKEFWEKYTGKEEK